MCGICFTVQSEKLKPRASLSSNTNEEAQDPPSNFLSNRGPDFAGHLREHLNSIHDDHLNVKMDFFGYVLHLRGDLTKQPLKDSAGNILLWNGEIFGGDIKVGNEENDGEKLLETLSDIKEQLSDEANAECITKIFSNIQGPWAFVYWQKERKLIWFGRDYFGRRSLLWRTPRSTTDKFILCSVKPNFNSTDFSEVPAKMLYCFETKDLLEFWQSENDTLDCKEKFECCIREFPMVLPKQDHKSKVVLHEKLGCTCLLKSGDCVEDNKLVGAEHVDQSQNSGGSKDFREQQKTHKTTEIDANSALILTEKNCAQDNPDLLCTVCKDINLNSDTEPPTIESYGNKRLLETYESLFLEVMEEATRKRVFNLPREKYCKSENSLNNTHGNLTKDKQTSKVGILFSGGIDSMVLAALADRCIPNNEAIDLFNVAFEQKLNIKQLKGDKKRNPKEKETKDPFDVPDRITGRSGVLELNATRQWNLIEINVTLDEVKYAREEHVKHLVYPLDTVLDDSIGCAIWFAASGKGTKFVLDNGKLVKQAEDYISEAKVLLTGMGADEQLGGYARHRSKFEKFGWKGLEEEMEMEIDRISSRNLGRDDRCISDHGREARFPFLDENVVSFLKTVPTWIKCDPRLPRGHGEKRLLREMGKKLNLHGAAVLPKRAIQFGSKIAKMENSKEKGSHTCNRLQKNDQQAT